MTIPVVLRSSIGLAFLVLVAATVTSWYLGDGHGAAKAATVGVIAVAFAKVYLVGHHFMELRHAPTPLRLVFGGWVVVVCTALVVMYLAT